MPFYFTEKGGGLHFDSVKPINFFFLHDSCLLCSKKTFLSQGVFCSVTVLAFRLGQLCIEFKFSMGCEVGRVRFIFPIRLQVFRHRVLKTLLLIGVLWHLIQNVMERAGVMYASVSQENARRAADLSLIPKLCKSHIQPPASVSPALGVV